MNDYEKIRVISRQTSQQHNDELLNHIEKKLKNYRVHELEHEHIFAETIDQFLFSNERLCSKLLYAAYGTADLLTRKNSWDDNLSALQQRLRYLKNNTVKEVIDEYESSFLELEKSLESYCKKKREHFV